jgi:hypothetical protein
MSGIKQSAATSSLSEQQKAEHKRLFVTEIDNYCKKIDENKGSGGVMSREKYDEIVTVITSKNEKITDKKHYKWKKEYVAVELLGNVLLVKKHDLTEATTDMGEFDAAKVLRVCHRDELYDIIQKVHVEMVGHAATAKTYNCIRLHYSNISRAVCEIFVKTCPVCALTKRTLARPEDFKPILTSGFGRRGQCDLIDMQSQPDGDFKWILHYQDHALKFSVLRALVSKEASTVANELFMIFCLIGAPLILHTDNGKEFTASVILALQVLWPSMQLINGRARHPQSQGSVERGNQDVEKMIFAWMGEHTSPRWSIGIHVVESQKNGRFHEGIKAIPYKLMFGQDQQIGVAAMHIDEATLARLNDIEQELDTEMTSLIYDDGEKLSNENCCDAFQRDTPCTQTVATNSSDIPISQDDETLNGLSSDALQTETQTTQSVAADPDAPSNDPSTISVSANGHERNHEPSPGRKRSRDNAFAQMVKQAQKMKKRAGEKTATVSELAVGCIVLITVDRVDRANVDPLRLPGVVLDKNEHDAYLIGCKGGILKTRYFRGDLIYADKKTPASYDLEEILSNWRDVRGRISVRAAMAAISPVGGQGHIHCNCKGKCVQKSCKCKKQGLLCNSRCHKTNSRCLNRNRDDNANCDEETSSVDNSADDDNSDALSENNIDDK